MDRSFDRKSCLLFLALLFAGMLVLSCLSPMAADDYSYCFSWKDNARITSVAQIPASMAVHRELTNGRVFTHGLVQLLLIRPKALFNVLNGLNAALLLALFSEYLEDRRRLALLALAASMLWTFQPAFGEVSLWLTGAVNYSWGVSLFLLFLRPYVRAWLGHAEKRPVWRVLLFLPLALVAGAWSESGSLAMLFAALCLTALTARRERRIDWLALAGIVLAALGFVFLMTAPATGGRAGSTDLTAALAHFLTIAGETLRRLGLLYLLWAFCFAAALRAGGDKKRIALALILLLAGLGALAAYSFALYFAKRHFCCTVFFTVLSVMILLEQALPALKKRPRKVLAVLLCLLFFARLAFGLLDIAVIYKKSLEREAAIAAVLAEGGRDITLESYVPRSGCSVAFTLDLSPDEWPNYSVALYYGLDSVTGYYPGEQGGG